MMPEHKRSADITAFSARKLRAVGCCCLKVTEALGGNQISEVCGSNTSPTGLGSGREGQRKDVGLSSEALTIHTGHFRLAWP